MNKFIKTTLLAEDNDGVDYWIDFYINVSKIDGWFVPLPNNEDGIPTINIIISGEVFSVKQEESIKDYLKNNCTPN